MGNKHSSENNLELYNNNRRLSKSIITLDSDCSDCSDFSDDSSYIPDGEKVNTNITNVIKISEEDKDLKFYFNEDNNIERQKEHYKLKKLLFQCEFSSPVKETLINGGKVLDLGCGAAVFLFDVAEKYPNSEFIGVDIDPTYPTDIKHKNLKFEVLDMFQGLPFPDDEFDLVNVGSLVFSITPDQLDILIREMIRVTKPNGYIEFDETHMTRWSRGVGDNFFQLLQGFDLVAKSYGANVDMALELPKLLATNQRINNVNVENRRLILGQNGGGLGIIIQFVLDWFNHSCEQFVDDACKQLHITKVEYDQLVEDTVNELKYTYPEVNLFRIYAQKRELIIDK